LPAADVGKVHEYVVCCVGRFCETTGEEHETGAAFGPVTNQVIDPPGVSPEVPVTTTESVVVPPRVVAVLVIEPIVGVRVETPMVTVFETDAV